MILYRNLNGTSSKDPLKDPIQEFSTGSFKLLNGTRRLSKLPNSNNTNIMQIRLLLNGVVGLLRSDSGFIFCRSTFFMLSFKEEKGSLK